MKKILIVASSLNCGGLEKSLIEFCNIIDYSLIEVDLYLFNDGRVLLDELNKNVNLLPDSPYYSLVYNQPLLKSVSSLIKNRKYGLAIYRIIRCFRNKVLNLTTLDKYDWKHMKKAMLNISKNYDVAIGFEEGTACYYVGDCINATNKNLWIHTDIEKINTNSYLDNVAFDQANKIFTVSQNSLNSLTRRYPAYVDKMKYVNIAYLIDKKKLLCLSNEYCEMSKIEAIKIVSVGRLVELKGFHLCVQSLKELIDLGYDAYWYIVGEGEYRTTIESLIKQYNMEEKFILIGNSNNPYKYIKNATLCVQPSSYEGFSLVVWEEKLLKKAVVVTKISSNYEMIEEEKSGLFVDRNSKDIMFGVKKLIDNQELLEIVSNTPAKDRLTQEEATREIRKTLA
ncbi:MAG: glycosyltransferase [Bacillota bacterium]